MNTIMVIHPYRENGIWMFDDEATGLEKEPFIEGVPEIIEEATAHIPNATGGFSLFFSSDPFPGHQVKLKWLRSEYGGNWYAVNGKEGWLCPALFHYFDDAPQMIYCRAQPKG